MPICGIIGATGYAGAELARILARHPDVDAISLASTSSAGKYIHEFYPNLLGASNRFTDDGRLVDTALVLARADVVFSAQPHGKAEELAAACLGTGRLFIDLSADFRFGTDEETYAAWYGSRYSRPDLHAMSVLGLPELYREQIRTARIIGNPGCYPTCAALGLFPAVKFGFAKPEGIIIDAKSGVTGSGREPTRSTHYPETADSLSPYKIGEHRHGPEIAAILASMAGTPVEALFTPHLAPMGRGIVSTNYVILSRSITTLDLRTAYEDFYAKEPFVRVLPEGAIATNRTVRFSNYCDISVHVVQDGRRAIIVSAIDNMVKGAAGQAVQNMNIALGFDETSGLSALPPAF